MSTVVFRASLSSLRKNVQDISINATPRRYRFLHCKKFVQNETLCIYEFNDNDHIPRIDYCALSYVWKGNPVSAAEARKGFRSFSVKDAEDGDPISINVLMHACKAAMQQGADYIWMDRLCIIQSKGPDKHWQIKRMYKIYQRCKVCIVLPGGIGRLVGLEEETTWIERGWTLQEAIAPPSVLVLFAWEHRPLYQYGTSIWVHRRSFPEVVPLESAILEISELFRFTNGNSWTQRSSTSAKVSRQIKILGGGSPVFVLSRILEEKDDEARSLALWRSTMMRTSSRPVDMVFSIMGTFGVTLDPSEYGVNDRVAATAALAKGILENGGRPTWIGLSFDLSPSPVLSSFPDFPKTSVAGKAYFRTDSGKQDAVTALESDSSSYLRGAPSGSMDDEGYLKITARSAPIIFTKRTSQDLNNDDGELFTSTDGDVWTLTDHRGRPLHGKSSSRRGFIVIVGKMRAFNTPVVAKFGDPYDKRAILLEEHKPNRYHRTSSFLLATDVGTDWEKNRFKIGGPRTLPAPNPS